MCRKISIAGQLLRAGRKPAVAGTTHHRICATACHKENAKAHDRAFLSAEVSVWQHKDDTSIYVDCLEQTIREERALAGSAPGLALALSALSALSQDRDHQGLFRLCKYFGGLPPGAKSWGQ